MSDLRLLEIDYATPPTNGQSAVYNISLDTWKPSSLTASSITGLTADAVLFGSSAGNIGQDASNFVFNDSVNRLSIGTSSNYTAKLNVLVGSATEKGLAIRLNGSQSANAIEIQNSGGTVLSGFREEGSLLIQNTTSTTIGVAGYYALSAKADGAAANCAFIVDRNRSQTNAGNGVGIFLKDSTSYVGMRMWANTFVQNLYDYEFFSQLGLTMSMPYSGGIYVYNPPVNTQDISCMRVPTQTIYPGAGANDPGGFFVFDVVTLAATSPNTMNDVAALLLKGAPIAGVNMTLTRRYNALAIAGSAGDVLYAARAHASQTGNLIECQSSTPTNLLAFVNKDGGFVFNEQGRDTDCRIEGDTDVNLFYTDASVDRIGIGKATPTTKLDIEGVLSVKQGLSSSVAHAGGSIFDHYADVKSVTTTETDLYSDTLPASALGTNGDKLEGVYSGIVVTHVTATRRIKLYFGGNAIFDTGALVATTSGAWIMFVHIIRVSSTVIRYAIRFDTQTMALTEPSITGELTGLTLSNTNVVKVTGQAGGAGAASDDIWVRTGKLKWVPAA